MEIISGNGASGIRVDAGAVFLPNFIMGNRIGLSATLSGVHIGNALSGIVTDTHSRVLRADGAIIEGLYATGVSTASPMGRVYPGAGASVGPSMCFGWIAAKHAAGLDNVAL